MNAFLFFSTRIILIAREVLANWIANLVLRVGMGQAINVSRADRYIEGIMITIAKMMWDYTSDLLNDVILEVGNTCTYIPILFYVGFKRIYYAVCLFNPVHLHNTDNKSERATPDILDVLCITFEDQLLESDSSSIR